MSAPTRLGRYPVRRRIGSGAFATVWLAYDEHLDSPVAIKVLADNWTEDQHVRQRFLEEGRFLRKVESPHVVAVYDAGELADGRPFLVMCFADQGSLADRLELAALTPGQTLHVVTQIGEGLTALHDHGVLHRDVKPANVLFRSVERGRGPGRRRQVCAMLGDLGLGKAMDMSSRLTMISGTPSYAAPEQAAGERLDPRADQYSLAALTYYLLAGRPPYDHKTLAAASEPGPVPPMGGVVPAEVDLVVRKGLARDRDDRYDDVAAYVAALTRAMEGLVSAEAPAREAWIPVDSELTQAAPRLEVTRPLGSAPPVDGSGSDGSDGSDGQDGRYDSGAPSADRSSRRRWPWLLAGAAALVLGLGGGWAVQQATSTESVLTDETSRLSVTVPEEWAAAVATERWTPPNATSDYAALSAGAAADWNESERPASGVFIGLLPEDELPTKVPQHPECETRGQAVSDRTPDGDESLTVDFTDCEGPDVTVERVVQVSANQLLWVQVRSEDIPTAYRVLDSVETHGM